ncbi:MAG: ferric reductase-like transmembrane domain-containing protein [Prevotellaceae bacterium]|jgi:DMSO/TMAO reductase YedYZ heme-binding membrane subunit|nr:ferric reductase-like transmembrane domain-containing protein [Prevotellaceae bacterium]
MVKLIIDFVQFLYSTLPLLTSLAVFTLLAVLLSKSIKKYATAYYIVLAIPFVLVAVPFIGRLFGLEMFNFSGIPFLGSVLRDYIHMGAFGFPLLVIIMYTGALNPKTGWVKRLLAIRKELSIISGFPVLTHSLVRVANNFPPALKFFTDNEEYMATTKVTNELGAGITSFSFVLGIVMLAIFLPLWVTSFDSVHKRMGGVKWKKLQKWAYVLYAALFIHAMGIQVGYMLNPRVRDMPRPAVEASAAANTQHIITESTATQQQPEKPSGENANLQKREREVQREVAKKTIQGEHGRQTKGFADMDVSPQAKRYLHIVSLVLIFGLYLYLRLRKAKKDAVSKVH